MARGGPIAVQWGGRCAPGPCRGPARITLRLPEEEAQRRSNRQPPVRLPGAAWSTTSRQQSSQEGWQFSREDWPAGAAAHSPPVKDHSTYLGAQRQGGGVGGVAHQQPGTRLPAMSGENALEMAMSAERRVRGYAPEATPLGCGAGMGTAPGQPTARVQC